MPILHHSEEFNIGIDNGRIYVMFYNSEPDNIDLKLCARIVVAVDNLINIDMLDPYLTSELWKLRNQFSARTSIQAEEQPRVRTREFSSPANARLALYYLLPRKNRQLIIDDLEEELNNFIIPDLGPKGGRRWFWAQTVFSILAGWRSALWVAAGELWRLARGG